MVSRSGRGRCPRYPQLPPPDAVPSPLRSGGLRRRAAPVPWDMAGSPGRPLPVSALPLAQETARTGSAPSRSAPVRGGVSAAFREPGRHPRPADNRCCSPGPRFQRVGRYRPLPPRDGAPPGCSGGLPGVRNAGVLARKHLLAATARGSTGAVWGPRAGAAAPREEAGGAPAPFFAALARRRLWRWLARSGLVFRTLSPSPNGPLTRPEPVPGCGRRDEGVASPPPRAGHRGSDRPGVAARGRPGQGSDRAGQPEGGGGARSGCAPARFPSPAWPKGAAPGGVDLLSPWPLSVWVASFRC